MKTAIRTPIVEAIRAAIKGFGGLLAPIFYWKGQNTLAATTGTDPTFTRATAATFEDFEGLIKTVESSEPRFQGARRVENIVPSSNDFSVVSWTKVSVTLQAGVADPFGGTDATTVTATAGSYLAVNLSTLATRLPQSGDKIRNSLWIRRRTGTGQINLYSGGDAYDQPIVTSSLTSSWQRLSVPVGSVVTAANNFVGVRILTAGDEVDIYGVQSEYVTGQTNQNPSEYVSTGVGTGPELVTNGDFASGLDDWSITGTDATNNITIVSGGARIFASPSSSPAPYMTQSVLEIGKTYVVTFDITDSQFGLIQVRSGSFLESISAVGSYTYTFTTDTQTTIGFRRAGVCDVTIDNVSVKAVDHGANVDGVQYFDTLNANTVTANVVTEAVGSALIRANTQFGELMAAGAYFSTPNVVTTWGELDIRARAQVDSIPNTYAFLAEKAGVFYLAAHSGVGGMRASITGFGVAVDSAVVPNFLGVRRWYRTTYNPATGDVKFFTADGNLEAPAISDYVQLGTTVNRAGTAIVVNTNGFLAGSYGAAPTTYPFDGDIYRSQVFNEIDGTTPVVDFTAGSYVSGSTLVSSTSGETWTLVGNASVFQPPVDASGPFGYLAEKASTNLVLQSEDFTTSWNPQAVTVTANAAVAPDGTTTMDRLVVNTATSFHNVYQARSLAAGTNYTASVYMKNDGAGFGGICLGSGNDLSVVVDLSTGLVTDTHTTGTGVLVAYGCDDVGNGIYRVWVSGNSSVPGYIIPFSSDVAVPATWSNGRPTYTGVAGEDILIWGAQVELSTYPTSYIPTTTTTVLRNADVLTAGDIITDAAGSGYAEASSIWSTAGNTSYLLSTNSSGRVLAGNAGQADTSIIVYDGATVATSPTGASYQNRPAPMASTWGDNLTAYLSGVGGTSAAYSGTMGSGSLNIGQRDTLGQQWNGTIREVKIFDSELTAEEVGDL